MADLATSFPGQQPNEKVYFILHRHWASLVGDFVRLLMLAILPAIIFIVAKSFLTWDFSADTLGYALAVMVGSLYYFFILNLAFSYWVDYLLDYGVVTDQRLLDVQQSGIFSRTVSELALHRVQDVTTEIKGIFPTLLKFGNIYIQTAAEKERFAFENMANPDEISKKIMALAEAHPQTVIAKTEAPISVVPVTKK